VHKGIDEFQEERAGNPCVWFKNGMSRQSDPFEQMTGTHPLFQEVGADIHKLTGSMGIRRKSHLGRNTKIPVVKWQALSLFPPVYIQVWLNYNLFRSLKLRKYFRRPFSPSCTAWKERLRLIVMTRWNQSSGDNKKRHPFGTLSITMKSFLCSNTVLEGIKKFMERDSYKQRKTQTNPMYGSEKLPKPERIYVYPFAATHADLPAWSSAAKQHDPPGEPQSPEHIEVGRKLGITVAEELVSEIQQMGLSSLVADKQTSPRINDLLLVGYFGTFEEGSALKRMAIGFGSGGAELKTAVEGYQMTNEGFRQLGAGKLQAGGGKTPGVVLPIVVLAATANPIGLVVGGVAKVYGEVSGKDTIEGEGKRTAEAIAEHLRGKFKEQGWIR
jgi:hypothetical protein